MAHGLTCLVLHLLLAEICELEHVLTPEFGSEAFGYKLFYSYLIIKKIVFRYLFAFCMMDSAVIASGLAYNGRSESGIEQFNRIISIRIYEIETSLRIKDFLTNWNISVHLWLKNYVFLRLMKTRKVDDVGTKDSSSLQKKCKESVFLPSMTTFVVSAIWHGFYPGYMVFFIGAGLTDYIMKYAEPCVVFFEKFPVKVPLYVALFAWDYLMCAFWALPFNLFSIEKIHIFHTHMFYWGYFSLALLFLVVFVTGLRSQAVRILKKREEKKRMEVDKDKNSSQDEKQKAE